MGVLSPQQKRELVAAYLAGKSSGVLAAKFHVHDSYPRWLAWARRNGGRPARPRWMRKGERE